MSRFSIRSSCVVCLLGLGASPEVAHAQASVPSARRPPEAAPTEHTEERLGDAAQVERVISLYAGGRYVECAAELSKLLTPGTDASLSKASAISRARLYHATCLIMSGDEEAARKPLRAALKANPTMGTPDSLTFPPPLVRLFLQVQKEFSDEIAARQDLLLKKAEAEARAAKEREAQEKLRVRTLEKLAKQEVVVVRNNRTLASVPFGVGQFQNGSDNLGYAFLVAESVALLTAGVSIFIVYDQFKHLRLFRDVQVRQRDVTRNQQTAYNVFVVSSWAFAGLVLGGIVEAHWNFVPEVREVHQRKLPAELTTVPSSQRGSDQAGVTPVLTPTRGGLGLSLIGTF